MSEKIELMLASTTLSGVPGGEIRTVITVRNASDIVDRYTIQAVGLPAGWVRQMGAHQIGVVALLPGESDQVTLVVQPPAGTEVGYYAFSVRATSEQNPAEQTSVAVSLEIQERGEYHLRLEPAEIRLSISGQMNLVVVNMGNAPLVVDLAASDPLGKAQLTVQPPAFHLAPRTEGMALLEVQLGQPPTVAQSIPFTVTATPRGGSQAPQSIEGTLHLEPPTRAWMELSPLEVADARQGHYTVHLVNPGDSPVTLRLEGRDPEDACTHLFEPEVITVPARGEASSDLIVRANEWHEGEGARQMDFTVRAVAVEGAATGSEPEPVVGLLIQQPRPPLSIELLPPQQSTRRRARFRLHLTSTRSETVIVSLAAVDPDDALQFAIRPDALEVRPGSLLEAELVATCKDRLPKDQPRRAHLFTVTATSTQGEIVQTEGMLAQTPGWSLTLPESPRIRRLLGLAVGLLGLLACGLCAIFSLIPPPQTPTPMPTSLPVKHTAVVQITASPGCAYPDAPQVAVTPLQVVAVATNQPAPAPQPSLAPPPVPLLAGGFLDLPIPYDGSAAEFRRLVNRRSLGGLITSYFDHEYPLYPWVYSGLKFWGNEPSSAPAGNSLLAFDGTRMDSDWYTGHPGYDLAPLPDYPNDTPILAAADGVVQYVAVQSDGNHVIQLRHYVPGLGEYLTIYMHMRDDTYWQAMQGRVGQAVHSGDRIGTMGSTGKSTGVHLHFEVRWDANGDGVFDTQERVDPFGFVPLTGPDPWALNVPLKNAQGQDVPHVGIISRYLWRQPLGVTARLGTEPARLALPRGGGEEAIVACVPGNALPPGSTLLVSWAPDTVPDINESGTDNGCLVCAEDKNGQPLKQFAQPLEIALHYTVEDVRDVDPATLTIYLYDPVSATWKALPTTIDPERQVATAAFPWPGRCALRGRPTVDRLPPRTTIELEGPRDPLGRFAGDVTVRLRAEDQGDSGVATIRYSLDYGATWLDYKQPFTIKYQAEPLATPAEQPDAEDSVVQEPGDRLILAQAEDQAGNVELPPAVGAFTLAGPTRTPTLTPSPTLLPPTPALSLRVEPTRISPPCCAKLAWQTQNADAVYLDDTPVGAQGNQDVCPTESHVYTLRIVSKAYGEMTRQVTVEVVPTTIQFAAAKTELACGQSTTLSWQVQNAFAVYLDEQKVDASGSKAVCLKASHVYTLRVVPPCGPDQTRQIAINVAPLTMSFTASPPQILPGCQCSTLKWDVDNVEAVYLDGQGVAGPGTQQVCINEPHTYVLRAVSGCCDPIEQRVTVGILPQPQISFRADKTTIKAGETVTLFWDVDNVEAVYLDGEGVGGHGSRQVRPTASRTYTLRAVWCGGRESREQQVSINVIACPKLEYARVWYDTTPIAAGMGLEVFWSSYGGCAPFDGTLTAWWGDQPDQRATYQITTPSGQVNVEKWRDFHCGMNAGIHLTLHDASGQTVEAEWRMPPCIVQGLAW